MSSYRTNNDNRIAKKLVIMNRNVRVIVIDDDALFILPYRELASISLVPFSFSFDYFFIIGGVKI